MGFVANFLCFPAVCKLDFFLETVYVMQLLRKLRRQIHRRCLIGRSQM